MVAIKDYTLTDNLHDVGLFSHPFNQILEIKILHRWAAPFKYSPTCAGVASTNTGSGLRPSTFASRALTASLAMIRANIRSPDWVVSCGDRAF
jgi:hypothetical protein